MSGSLHYIKKDLFFLMLCGLCIAAGLENSSLVGFDVLQNSALFGRIERITGGENIPFNEPAVPLMRKGVPPVVDVKKDIRVDFRMAVVRFGVLEKRWFRLLSEFFLKDSGR
jgi:hypothetical protein